MKKYAIRLGIYETNSSSSHSFSFGQSGRYADIIKPDESGNIEVSVGDWNCYYSESKFNDAYLKLSYLFCFVISIYSTDEEEDKKILGEKLNNIKKVVKEFTGAKKVIINDDGTNIDHQSLDIIDTRDLDNPEFIKEFVFNPDTWVYTVWDSFEPEDDFYENQDKRLLYTLKFNLPGISKNIEIPITYQDVKSRDVENKICDVLSGYVLYGDIFYEYDNSVFKKNCITCYNGGSSLKFGDYILEPEIILSNDKK